MAIGIGTPGSLARSREEAELMLRDPSARGVPDYSGIGRQAYARAMAEGGGEGMAGAPGGWQAGLNAFAKKAAANDLMNGGRMAAAQGTWASDWQMGQANLKRLERSRLLTRQVEEQQARRQAALAALGSGASLAGMAFGAPVLGLAGNALGAMAGASMPGMGSGVYGEDWSPQRGR